MIQYNGNFYKVFQLSLNKVPHTPIDDFNVVPPIPDHLLICSDSGLRWLSMLCVKAPMLATYSLLPIIQRFAKPMGVEVMSKMTRARICKPFKELRNRFPA
jgi:hypothetical protein